MLVDDDLRRTFRAIKREVKATESAAFSKLEWSEARVRAVAEEFGFALHLSLNSRAKRRKTLKNF